MAKNILRTFPYLYKVKNVEAMLTNVTFPIAAIQNPKLSIANFAIGFASFP